jgi:hypothetical protein
MGNLSVQSSQFSKSKRNSGLIENVLFSLGLAGLGGTVAYFAFGFLMFWLVPASYQ